jgi:hypothetical protein
MEWTPPESRVALVDTLELLGITIFLSVVWPVGIMTTREGNEQNLEVITAAIGLLMYLKCIDR